MCKSNIRNKPEDFGCRQFKKTKKENPKWFNNKNKKFRINKQNPNKLNKSKKYFKKKWKNKKRVKKYIKKCDEDCNCYLCGEKGHKKPDCSKLKKPVNLIKFDQLKLEIIDEYSNIDT